MITNLRSVSFVGCISECLFDHDRNLLFCNPEALDKRLDGVATSVAWPEIGAAGCWSASSNVTSALHEATLGDG